MPKSEHNSGITRKSGYCSRQQIRELKRSQEEQQQMLSDLRLRMMQQQKALDEANKLLAEQMDFSEKLMQQMSEQREIMSLFYKEYQALKRRQGKEQLMNYIRMRDSMLKDIALYKERHQTNTTGYKLLTMYADDLTQILEDQGVEILTESRGTVFNPEVQKPIRKVDVYREDQNNLVYQVFNCGYRMDGVMLKKMEVAVCVYS